MSAREGRTRTVLIVSAVVAVVLAGAVYAFDRLAVSITGEGPLTVFKPSASDVLDGWTARSQREAALTRIETGLGAIQVEGATEIGRQIYTKCVRGTNNWKTHSGIRLQCSANGRVYSGWSGDYETGRDGIRAAMGPRCTLPERKRDDSVPKKWVPSRETFECDDGTRVSLIYGDFEDGVGSNSGINDGVADDNTRHVSGMEPGEFGQALDGYRWYAVHHIYEVYYQDQP